MGNKIRKEKRAYDKVEIEDDAGRAFWEASFETVYSVNIHQLISALREHFSDKPPKHLELICRHIIDLNEVSWVCAKFLDHFLKLYGPFEEAFYRCESTVLQDGTVPPWFHGRTHEYICNELLQNAQVGEFLVRHTFEGERTFTISYRNLLPSGAIETKKELVFNLGNGYCLAKIPSVHYPLFKTLTEIVESKSANLITPIVSELYKRVERAREMRETDWSIDDATHVVEVKLDIQMTNLTKLEKCQVVCMRVDDRKCKRTGRSISFGTFDRSCTCTGSQGNHHTDVELSDTQIIIREKTSSYSLVEIRSTVRLIHEPFEDSKYPERKSNDPIGKYGWARILVSGVCTECGMKKATSIQSNQDSHGFTYSCKCKKLKSIDLDRGTAPYITAKTVQKWREDVFGTLIEAVSGGSLDITRDLVVLLTTFLY